MTMTYTQKRELFENGYTKIEGAIPRLMVNDALKAINHSLGEGLPREDMIKFRAQSFCPEVQSTSVILDLFYQTPVKSLIGSVIELEQIHPIRNGQIALRFPANTSKPAPSRPHLDGMYTPDNGVKEGTISNFTALVCVLLSDLPEEHAGNFTVWPKTHHQYEQYFQKHGAESLLKGLPRIDLPEPVQIIGKAGDVVIAHYMLGHGIPVNISPHTRYAIFFRVKHKEIDDTNWPLSMQDIWMHWPGMQEFVSTAAE